jgi:hypothetical protein
VTVSLTVVRSDLTFAAWLAEGERLVRDHDDRLWRIGDWWNAGEKWDRERTAMLDSDAWSGPDRDTCHTCGWVARRFEISRRRENLSFGHHRELASATRVFADELLHWCVAPLAEGGRRRSIAELRGEKRAREARQIAERELPAMAEARVRISSQPWPAGLSPSAPFRIGQPVPRRVMRKRKVALEMLERALGRCLLNGVPSPDVKYTVWQCYERLQRERQSK